MILWLSYINIWWLWLLRIEPESLMMLVCFRNICIMISHEFWHNSLKKWSNWLVDLHWIFYECILWRHDDFLTDQFLSFPFWISIDIILQSDDLLSLSCSTLEKKYKWGKTPKKWNYVFQNKHKNIGVCLFLFFNYFFYFFIFLNIFSGAVNVW